MLEAIRSRWRPSESAPRTAGGRSRVDPVAIVTGISSALLGIIFLAFPDAFRGGRACHFNLAVMGCGFVAMGLNWPVAARWLAVAPGLMSLATFIGYVAFGPPGLDTIIMLAIWPELTKAWGGDLNADLAYALTAAAIFLLTKPGWRWRWRSTVIVLAASSVVGLGFVGLAGYITGLRTAYGIRRLVEVTADSIVGVLLLGTGLLVISWRKSRHIPAERQAWILVAIAMSGFVVSTSLWQALMLVQKLPIQSTQQFRSYLARTVFTFGLMATGLLGVALSLIQKLRGLNEELEGRVQQQTAQLQAANKELEAFSYSVSHDLRAPLRAINGFAHILLADYKAELPAEAQRHLEQISRGSSRMNELIEALLEFSRLGRQELHKTRVPVERVVSGALEDLQADREGRRIEIAVGNLAACEADPLLLRQVFANLLSNAIKFTRPQPAARIEIGMLDRAVTPAGAAVTSVYYVRDNGVGFDMRYADRLFRVFERLDTRQGFEGTGIGLATVKRIVERHGGLVWADSDPGKGATFYFTIDQTRRTRPTGTTETAGSSGTTAQTASAGR